MLLTTHNAKSARKKSNSKRQVCGLNLCGKNVLRRHGSKTTENRSLAACGAVLCIEFVQQRQCNENPTADATKAAKMESSQSKL